MSAISDLFLAGMDEVRRSWGWFFAGGTLLILLGVMCVVKAETATTFSVLVLGWILPTALITDRRELAARPTSDRGVAAACEGAHGGTSTLGSSCRAAEDRRWVAAKP